MGFFLSWPFRKRPCRPLLWRAGLLLVPAVLGMSLSLRIVAAAAQETATPAEIDVLAGLVFLPAELGIVPPATEETAAAAEGDVTVEDGVLSVHVRDARLGDVLRAIAERTGLRFKLAGDLGRPITAWFAVSVEQGIRQLVGDNGLIMIYAPARGQTGQSVLTEIRVYGPPDGRVVTIEPVVRESSFDRVHEGLGQLDRKSQLRAVRELRGLNDEAAAVTLVGIVARSEDSLVRRTAAQAVRSFSSNTASAALTTALMEEEPSVRMQAIRVLSKVSGSEAVNTLGQALVDDPDTKVRRMAAWALGTLRSEEARLVLEAAASDPRAAIREAAASALRGLTSAAERSRQRSELCAQVGCAGTSPR